MKRRNSDGLANRPPPWAVTLALPRRAAAVATAAMLLILAPFGLSLLHCPGPSRDEPPTPADGAASKTVGPSASDTATAPPVDAGATAEQPIAGLFPEIAELFNGDLAQIRQRRLLRVLVSYGKSNFFFDGGRPRGFEQELLSAYEEHLNAGVRRSDDRVKMVFVPMPFDQLLLALRDGRGDVAAAGLTVTPERERIVAFTSPYVPRVREVVVVNRAEQALRGLDDLAGRRVYVRTASSYVLHLESLSRELVQRGQTPLEVVEVDRYLVTEDILELVNAGVLGITVADEHIAKAWGSVLPDIDVRDDLAINSEGSIAWAVRQDNPELLSDLNAFIRKHRKGSLVGNVLFERYFENSKWIRNPLSESDRKKLDELVGFFQDYGDRFGFDRLALAAQAYQESGLDNRKRSRSGAVGIMQVLPSTASDRNVDVKDIHQLENNIHAGVKYLAFLRDHYFSGPEIPEAARDHFAWAAYNAGPRRIQQIRQSAEKKGFDPNEWFFNVEKEAARVIGRETVTYVANVRKYYVAYKLLYEAAQQREAALQDAGEVSP